MYLIASITMYLIASIIARKEIEGIVCAVVFYT